MRYDKQQRKENKIKDELTKLKSSHAHLHSVVESLMHESRRFSAEITSYSEELSRISIGTTGRIKELSDTIFYTAGLLSSRMAFSDFELNPQSIRKQLPVRTSIYKKFDKARYILSKEAKDKFIQIKFYGNSMMELD
jgi:predicted nuclease with TOPRIM domain